MSKFTKVYRKWHSENNGKYDSAWEYHKALIKNFKDWQQPKKLVEVPQFVADFIEDKKGKLKIFGSFREISQKHGGSELYKWVFGNADSQEFFAKAWVDGYTVKKEQLYEVIINGLYLVKLTKFTDSKDHVFCYKDKLCNWLETGYKLTEAEIKGIDERYWAFAVKVDEVDK